MFCMIYRKLMATEIKRELTVTSDSSTTTAVVAVPTESKGEEQKGGVVAVLPPPPEADNSVPLYLQPRKYERVGSDHHKWRTEFCGEQYFDKFDPLTARMYSIEAKMAKKVEAKSNKKQRSFTKQTDAKTDDEDDIPFADKIDSTDIPSHVERDTQYNKSAYDNGPKIFVQIKRFGAPRGSAYENGIKVYMPMAVVGYALTGRGNFTGNPEAKGAKTSREQSEMSLMLPHPGTARTSVLGEEGTEELNRFFAWTKALYDTLRVTVIDTRSSRLITEIRQSCIDTDQAPIKQHEANEKLKLEPLLKTNPTEHKKKLKELEAHVKAEKAALPLPTYGRVFDIFMDVCANDQANTPSSEHGPTMIAKAKLYRFPTKAEAQAINFKTPEGKERALRAFSVLKGADPTSDAYQILMANDMLPKYPEIILLGSGGAKVDWMKSSKLITSGTIVGLLVNVGIHQSYEHKTWRLGYEPERIGLYKQPQSTVSISEIEDETTSVPIPRIAFSGADDYEGVAVITSTVPLAITHVPAVASSNNHNVLPLATSSSPTPPAAASSNKRSREKDVATVEEIDEDDYDIPSY